MGYDFDTAVPRQGTACSKWDDMKAVFGRDDLLPMWVADMDFRSPPEVVDALKRRAEHGVFGYTFRTDEYHSAVLDWQRRRHGWTPDAETLCGSPGVVTSLSLLIDLLTQPGDAVLVQTPVYPPFLSMVTANGRKLVTSSLKELDGRYIMDFEQLERDFSESQVKLMLLCSPHNPVGRVWTRDELLQLGELCEKYGVIVLADEIHGDIVFSGHKHIPYASLSEAHAQHSVVLTSIGKTFNVAGLHTSFAFIANPQWREKFRTRIQTLALLMENCFAYEAVIACYRHGEAWLGELLALLEANSRHAFERISRELPEVKAYRAEGTYLLWLDCRAVSEDPNELQRLMVEEAGVALTSGVPFGPGGEGRLRVNLGCPRPMLDEALDRVVRTMRERLDRYQTHEEEY